MTFFAGKFWRKNNLPLKRFGTKTSWQISKHYIFFTLEQRNTCNLNLRDNEQNFFIAQKKNLFGNKTSNVTATMLQIHHVKYKSIQITITRTPQPKRNKEFMLKIFGAETHQNPTHVSTQKYRRQNGVFLSVSSPLFLPSFSPANKAPPYVPNYHYCELL